VNTKLDLNLDAVREAAKDFALDVWEDLSRTRLSGVAVGLALALLVLTGVAVRPGGEADGATTGPIVAATAADEKEISFTGPDDTPLRMSDVDLSAPRDPFRSLDGVADSDQTLLAADEQIIDAVMGGSAGGSSTGSSASSLMPLDDLASTPATTPSPTPAPTTGDGEPEADFDGGHEPTDAPSAPATDYSYTADVQFGLVDDLERFATVQRLGLIPRRSMPLIMYLGVSDDHQTAVFMVDSRLSQGGEGNCVPRPSLCTFLELRATPSQDEHHFRDADGNEYLLRLRGLDRVTATSGSLSGRDVSELRDSPSLIDGQG